MTKHVFRINQRGLRIAIIVAMASDKFVPTSDGFAVHPDNDWWAYAEAYAVPASQSSASVCADGQNAPSGAVVKHPDSDWWDYAEAYAASDGRSSPSVTADERDPAVESLPGQPD